MPQASSIRAGRAFVEASLDTTKLERGLKNAQRKLRNFGAGVAKIGAGVSALGAAVLAPLAAATRDFTKTGDALDKMSARTGIAVESLSGLIFATEQSGQSGEQFEAVIIGMTRQIRGLERGLSTSKEAFDDLGISFGDIKNLSPEKQFLVLAEKLSKIEDPTRRAGIAMQVFGRSGRNLLPLLSSGVEGIKKLTDEAEAFGLIVSTEDAAAAAKLTDLLNLLWRVMKRGVFAIGAGLAPVLIELADKMTHVAAIIGKWIDKNRDLVITVAKVAAGVLAAGVAITAIGVGIIALGAMLGSAATVVGFFGAAMTAIGGVIGFLLSPLGLLIAAVTAIGVWFLKTSDVASRAAAFLGEKFGVLATIATDAFGAIRDSLSAGDIPAAANVLWAALNLVWVQGTGSLVTKWIKAKAVMLATWQGFQTGIAGMFLKTIAAVRNAWAKFVGWFEKKWTRAQTNAAKLALRTRATFDKSFDLDAAIQILDDDQRKRESGIDAETLDTSQGISSQLQDQLGTLAEMAAQDDRNLTAGTDAELAAARGGLDDARANFDAAKNAAPAAGIPGEGNNSFGSTLQGLLDSLGQGMASAPASTGGTFSSMTNRMFGGPDDLMKKQLETQQEIATNTGKMRQALQDGGLSFLA